MSYKDDIHKFIKENYNIEADYPWEKTPDYSVFRHNHNKKWFALVMNIEKKRLNIDVEENIDIINLKCPPELIGSLRSEKGILPAYHMNKEHWITVLLDGTYPLENIHDMIEISYDLTK